MQLTLSTHAIVPSAKLVAVRRRWFFLLLGLPLFMASSLASLNT